MLKVHFILHKVLLDDSGGGYFVRDNSVRIGLIAARRLQVSACLKSGVVSSKLNRCIKSKNHLTTKARIHQEWD